MSTRVDIRHVFHCSQDDFWQRVFDNRDFDQELYVQTLGFPTYSVLEHHVADDGIMKRTVKSTPKADAPAVIRKALGDNISYIETGTYDSKAQRYEFDIEPNRLPDKIKIRGHMWSEAEGDECVRRVEITVDVKIFGVGGVVEKFIASSLRDNYEKAAEFTNRWLAKNPS